MAWCTSLYPLNLLRMAKPPQAGSLHHPPFLGHPGWAIHQGQYSPEERLILHPSKLLNHTLADLHSTHQRMTKMQAQAREAVYWPNIDTDMINYIKGVKYAPNTSLPFWLSPCYPETSPIAHGRRSLVIAFTTKAKSTFSSVIYSASTHSIQSNFQVSPIPFPKASQANSQIQNPSWIYTDNCPPFASYKFMQFLQHQHINHTKSSPYFL